MIYVNLVLCVAMPFASAVNFKAGDKVMGSLCLVAAVANGISAYFAFTA